MEETLFFRTPEEFRLWLTENFDSEQSVWLQFEKVKKPSLTHTAALEEALCFGWIDSQLKKVDERFYIIKFSKRRARSRWSPRNRKIVEKLLAEGRMAEPGLRAVELAKEKDLWESPEEKIEANFIDDFVNLMSRHGEIFPMFMAKAPSFRKLAANYYFSAKTEDTRRRRMDKIIESINTGKPLL
jgi:uncharacterized protein YdeI (YjbR/CyaY-like superfamily)